jgi:hypothetical protein
VAVYDGRSPLLGDVGQRGSREKMSPLIPPTRDLLLHTHNGAGSNGGGLRML